MPLADAHANPATRMPTLLDRPERRFPLALGVEIRKARDLFRAATRNQWDPQTDSDWSALDGLDLDDAHRYAARMYCPMHHPRPDRAPRLIGVGGAETNGFIRQSEAYAETLGTRARVYPGLDHYTIMSALADPASELHRDVRTIIDGARR